MVLLIEKISQSINNNTELIGNKNISFYIAPETNINILSKELKELKNIKIDNIENKKYFLNVLKMELEYFQELQDIYKSDVLFKDNNLFLITPKHKQIIRKLLKELRNLIKTIKRDIRGARRRVPLVWCLARTTTKLYGYTGWYAIDVNVFCWKLR